VGEDGHVQTEEESDRAGRHEESGRISGHEGSDDALGPAEESDEARAYEAPARRTTRDMVISLLVLLMPIAFIVAVFRLQGGEDPVVIDPSPVLSQAEASGDFAVSRPRGLAEGWRPVSAVFRREDGGAILRVGFLTPSGGGVQLIESDQPAEQLLGRELGGSVRPAGTVDIAGKPWQSYEVRNDERALVLTDRERTLIVIGRAEADELRALAAAVG
jgi:hypothetical protein